MDIKTAANLVAQSIAEGEILGHELVDSAEVVGDDTVVIHLDGQPDIRMKVESA